LDVAASEFFVKESGNYDLSQKTGKGDRIVTPDQLIDLYEKLTKNFPIKSIEDPFDQDDFESYKKMNKRMGKDI
jgi:enolase